MSTSSLPLRPKRVRSDSDTATQPGQEELGDAATAAEPVEGVDNEIPVRRSSERMKLDEELADRKFEQKQEAGYAKQTILQAKPYLPRHHGVVGKEQERKRISRNWTRGWLQHFDAEIRPHDLSRNLIHDLVVISTFMNVAGARDALRSVSRATGHLARQM